MSKANMAKAFGRVDWSFRCKLLYAFGLNQPFLELIIYQLTNSWFRIHIGGHGAVFLTSSCGLKHDNPISLYMFITMKEALSIHIQNITSHGQICQFCTRGPALVVLIHLLNADDDLFFVSAASRDVNYPHPHLIHSQPTLIYWEFSVCQSSWGRARHSLSSWGGKGIPTLNPVGPTCAILQPLADSSTKKFMFYNLVTGVMMILKQASWYITNE